MVVATHAIHIILNTHKILKNLIRSEIRRLRALALSLTSVKLFSRILSGFLYGLLSITSFGYVNFLNLLLVFFLFSAWRRFSFSRLRAGLEIMYSA